MSIKLNYQDRVFVRKAAYTLMVIAVSIMLAHIPVVAAQHSVLSQIMLRMDALTFADVLAGGALSQMGMAGFAVSSIITASLVTQILSLAFPRLETLRNGGEHGRVVMDRINTTLAVALTLILGSIVAMNLLGSAPLWEKAVSIIQWVGSTWLISYLANGMRLKGIGQGITVILAANITTRIPALFVGTNIPLRMWLWIAGVLAVTVPLAIIMQMGRLNIPVSQTRKQQVSRNNTTGYIPVPLIMSSVLPIIYAMGFMMIPQILSIAGVKGAWLDKAVAVTTPMRWYTLNTQDIYGIIGLIIYVALIVVMSFWASHLTYSTQEIANRMRERGDVIEGYAPGEETERYLSKQRRKITTISVAFILAIVIIPEIVLTKVGIANLPFTGTSLIILVAAWWDMKSRVAGMVKHRQKKYKLFPTLKKASN